jgi:hypothetical protein
MQTLHSEIDPNVPEIVVEREVILPPPWNSTTGQHSNIWDMTNPYILVNIIFIRVMWVSYNHVTAVLRLVLEKTQDNCENVDYTVDNWEVLQAGAELRTFHKVTSMWQKVAPGLGHGWITGHRLSIQNGGQKNSEIGETCSMKDTEWKSKEQRDRRDM